MNNRTLLSVLLFTCFLFGACAGGGADDVTYGKLDESRDSIGADVQNLAAQAEAAARAIEQGAAAESVLLSLVQANKDLTDAALMDSDGRLVLVEPAEYKGAEGVDVSGQAHAAYMLTHHQPVLSDIFTSVEGTAAIDLQWPLENEGEFTGAVSLLIDYLPLFTRTAAAVLAGTKFNLTIQQLDGTVLYDNDPTQVGKNILTDPAFQPYPDLVRQVKETVASPAGTGSYTFTAPGTTEPVVKDCAWTTLSLYHAEWRIVLFWEHEG